MNTFTPKLKPTELSSLMKRAEVTVRLRMNSEVHLNMMLGATECKIMTDPNLLSEALMNLLVNACQFTLRGAVTFGYEIYDNEIVFTVKDTGIGLNEEYKGRLKRLFYNNDTQSPGLGLGIPTVYAIVRSLGGSMDVESRGQNYGTTFTFTIPHVPVEEETQSGVDAAGGEASGASSRPLILVAEDNDNNYFLFQKILERSYDVIHAMDGQEAVDMNKQYHPDLIIMDIQMPRKDGYQATIEIRNSDASDNRDVPIIASTAYGFVTDRDLMLSQGFNGYVSKPINRGRLEREIHSCLEAAGKKMPQ